MHYSGYTPIEELPVKKGDTVLIPRGAFIRTMHPSKHDRYAGRSYRVRVNHTLGGSEVQVGHVYTDGSFREACWHGDLRSIKEEYGTEDIASLWPVMKVIGNIVLLPLSNPSVRWPGEGGYWCEVDINDVVKA